MMKRNVMLLLSALIAFSAVAQKQGAFKAEKQKKADIGIEKKAEVAAKPVAKTVAEPVAKPQPAPLTPECNANISLFAEAAKQKNYADALTPWESAFANCKGTHRAIYTYGVKIVDWQISQEKDPAVREQLIDKLMAVYDEQILYFGDDTKQPRAYLLGMKAYYLLQYRPTEKQTAYEWLSESVHTLGKKAQPAFFQQFISTSYELYKADNTLATQFINDYVYANDIVEKNAADQSLKNAAVYAKIAPVIDQVFALSGAADCEQMDKIYAAQVENRKADYEFLTATTRLYRQVNCRESEVYFKAAEYAHSIKPTAESAAGCAAMSYKKGDYAKAIDYYLESVSMQENAEEIADNYLKIAQIYNANLNNFVKAREYARKSLEANPNQGAPYLLIGLMYANTRGIYDSAALNKTVYWVAVDKFIKAKQVEPALEEKANELIRSYAPHFPSKEEIFFEPDLEDGKAFTVGGWIGETTICR